MEIFYGYKLFKKNVEENGKHIDLIKQTARVFFEDFGGFAPEQCFGKAQKVINMGLKYLYCINSPLIKIDYENRDMPLDDMILDFYYDYKRSKRLNELGNKVTSWSNINELNYLTIQSELKKYIEEMNLKLSPIEAEFILWNYAIGKKTTSEYEKAKNACLKLKSKAKATIDCHAFISGFLNNKPASSEDLFSFYINKKDCALIERALTDRSFKAERSRGIKNNNPKYDEVKNHIQTNSDLATLGDAVLKLCLSTILLDEVDQLSVEKAKYESDKYLVTKVAKRYDLLKYIKKDNGDDKMPDDYDYDKSKNKGNNPHKYIATAVEAVLGAIYLETNDIASLIELVTTWVS